MKDSAQYKRKKEFRSDLLWNCFELMNYLMMTAAFSICSRMSVTFKTEINLRPRLLVSLLIFFILYILFSKIYDGLRVSIQRISEMIYSQMMACIFSDFFMFFSVWMITGRFIFFTYLIFAFFVQTIISFLWSLAVHRLYHRVTIPAKTALIYNKRSGIDKLIREYGLEHKYNVQAIYNVNEVINNISLLSKFETIFTTDIHSKERNKILKYCVENHIQMFLIPRVGDTLMSGSKPMHMFHLPMLEANGYRPSPFFLIAKRAFDIVVSTIALVILSPVFLITAAAIKAEDHGPVFYRQERMTQYGRNFMIHKFRSMCVDAEKDGIARLSTGANDDRITRTGRFIRAYRIDELPQLIDILKGNLSVVGPRPEREAIARQYEEVMPEFRLRLEAKAGLTGYAQVYGKYNTTPYDKLQMDLMYIAHPSILQDLKICFATVKIMFLPDSTEGVAEGSVTAIDGERYGNE